MASNDKSPKPLLLQKDQNATYSSIYLKRIHIKITVKDIFPKTPQKVIDSHPDDRTSLKLSEQLL